MKFLKALILGLVLLAGAAKADNLYNPPTYSRVAVIRGTFTMPALNNTSQVAATITASTYATPYTIDSIYLDLSPMTLNLTAGFRTKIDGSNYQQIGTDASFLASATNKGVFIGPYGGLTSDSQVVLLSTGLGEPVQKVVSYTIVIRY